VLKLTYGRLPRSGIILHLQAPNLAVLAVAVAVLMVAAGTASVMGILVTLPIWLPLLIIGAITRDGLPAVTLIRRRLMFTRRKAKGETSYRHRPEAPEFVELVREGYLTLPGRSRNVRLLSLPDGSAVAHDTARQTATIVCTVASRSFTTVGADRQDESVQALMGVMRGWTMRPGLNTDRARVTQSAIATAGSVRASERHIAAARARRRGAASAGLAAVDASYDEALGHAGARVRAHLTDVAITLDLRALTANIKAAGGGLRGLGEVVQLERDTSAQALGEAFDTVSWLTPGQVRGRARLIVDPESEQDLLTRAAENNDDAASPHAEVSAGGEAIMSMDEHRDYVEAESGFHRVYWIFQWPAYEMRPGFLGSVIFGELPPPEGGPVRHVVTIVSRPVSIAKALGRIKEQKKAWEASDRIRQKRGEQTSEADKQAYAELIGQEQRIGSGDGQLDTSAYITVTATSLAGLERASSAMQTHMANAGLEVRLLRNQQAEALMAAMVPTGEGLA